MSTKPALSIIIPVLNEVEGINGLITHLRTLERGSDVEIIVVDGDPAGNTINAVVDRGIIIAAGERGRGNQMNRGAALANSDVLLFLHADTFLPKNAVISIGEALCDPEYVAGCFDLGISSPRRVFRITERYVAWRTHITRIPFGDQAIFIRRDYFERIGGFKDIPIMEDVELMRRIRGRGDVICIIPEKVSTSSRRWEKEGVLFTTVRNWMLQLLYVLGVPPERLVRFYR
jgi:rSAM/selenodomain-associated transferase 2